MNAHRGHHRHTGRLLFLVLLLRLRPRAISWPALILIGLVLLLAFNTNLGCDSMGLGHACK